jgi:hypothetical protein
VTVDLVPTRGLLRLLRGTTVAGMSTLLAAAGHATAGGRVPGIGLLVVLGALLSVLTTSLADRRVRLSTMLLTLGAAQLALHGLLEVMSGHHHGDEQMVEKPLLMIAVHVLGTVVSALLLAHADRVLFLVASALRRIAPARLRPYLGPGATLHLVPGPALGATVHRFRWVTLVGLRGPPVGC